jgi:hypothetical protein
MDNVIAIAMCYLTAVVAVKASQWITKEVIDGKV